MRASRFLLGAALLLGCGHEPTGSSTPPYLKNVIVFISPDRSNRAEAAQLYRMRPDGSDLRAIPLAVRGYVSLPAVSPDGREIAFGSDVDIWVVNADGSGGRNLTMGVGNNFFPAWSPDGGRIAFMSDRGEEPFGHHGIYVMNADGTDVRKVVAGGEGLSWSPDGTRLAFDATDTTGRHIFIVTLADGVTTPITTGPYLDDDPAWSPDGGRIVFGSTRGTTNELYVMNADGSDIRLLPTPGLFGRWSPDGRRITFQCSGTDLQSHVCVINADGTGLTLPTSDSTVSDQEPTWSP